MSNVKTREDLATEFANLLQKQIGRSPRKIATFELSVVARLCAKYGVTLTYLSHAIGTLWSVDQERLEKLGLTAKKLYAKLGAQRSALQKKDGLSEEDAEKIFPKIRESVASTGKRGRQRMNAAAMLAAVNSAEETLFAESDDETEELEESAE